MSFHIGEEVRIREDAEEGCDLSSVGWNLKMRDTIGQIGMISKVLEGDAIGCYRVSLNGGADWFYPGRALEKIGEKIVEGGNTVLKTKKTFMSIIKNLGKTKEVRALESFALLNEDGSLNSDGRAEFVTFLFQGAAKDAFEAKILEAYEEKTKKDCK